MKEIAIVITGTIGKNSNELRKCIESVLTQSVLTKHLLVVDGKEHEEKVKSTVKEYDSHKDYIDVAVLPYNTGSNGFYAHRIMAAFAHLHDYEYTLYLDEDNWIDCDHVDTQIQNITNNDYLFSHSLRKIFSKEGEFICIDDCESLGIYPIYGEERNGHLVDTSSYCFKTDFLIKVSQLWHKGWGADRSFFSSMMKMKSIEGRFGGTGYYTLNYRLGGNEDSVKSHFFEYGNGYVYSNLKSRPWSKE